MRWWCRARSPQLRSEVLTRTGTKVKKILDQEMLIAIAQKMTATQEELIAKGDPRKAVPSETKHAAAL
jgi:hypothetical protein